MAASSSPTTLIPNGVSNAAPGSTLETLLAMDPTVVHNWFDDFDAYSSGAVYTVAGTGAAVALSSPTTPGAGGWILVGTATGTGTDGGQIQLADASFSFSAAAPIPAYTWFKTRLRIADATNSIITAGLAETIAATTFPVTYTDGVYFAKAGGSTNVQIVGLSGGSAIFTAFTVGVLANNTVMTLGYFYDGINSTLNVYVNDTNVANVPAFTPPTAAMNPTLSCGANTNAAQQMLVDYLFVSNARRAIV